MKGQIRIIGGRWRGRRLKVIDRPGLRPSGDRTRETLFNWLAGIVPGARCLDLFAGTGALGLEAASRGAREVALVERDVRLAGALSTIRDDWPGADAIRVERDDALRWLKRPHQPFDVIFIDPPFDTDLADRALALIREHGLLAEDGCIYLETDSRTPAPEGWTVVKEKRLGDVAIRLLGSGE